MQSSLPAGWLAFTGRESNPLDHYKRFQITLSSPSSGFILAQRTVDFLRTTMTEFKVTPQLQNEVITLVGSTRSSIVECEADTFGCR